MMHSDVKEKHVAIDNRQCKWRNMFFTKSGRSGLGRILWDSQEKAAESLNQKEPSIRKNGVYCLDGKDVEPGEYAWGMQIPVLV